jgi:2-C-methyl-D-erythritol 4-phosphate cytidylyltransferase/2-C-methyl-D-erythritol 2,4-cyclodiphosphate synthase
VAGVTSAAPVVSVIIAAGGQGVRLGAEVPKQFLEIGGRSLLESTIERFATHPGVAEVIVALPAAFVQSVAARMVELGWAHVHCVEGGARRQDSVAYAVAHARVDASVIVIHDAARPFVSAALIDRTIAAAVEHGAAIAALPVTDTVKQAGGARSDASRPIAATLPREDIFLAQTPQAFRRDVLVRAIEIGRELGLEASDEATLTERAGWPAHLVAGEAINMKITTREDFERARRRLEPAIRVGTGYDLHRLVEGRALILGGVTIPFEKGLDGHSDADIVCHAVTDAVLGAAAAGDIGRLFPDSDPRWQGADSLQLLRGAVAQLRSDGYRVSNVDVTVIAERPKLLPHLAAMQANLASALEVAPGAVSIKGKTNEQVDSMGRGESMACHAVALVVRQ